MVAAPELEAVRRRPAAYKQPPASVEEAMCWIEESLPVQVFLCGMFLYPGFTHRGTLAPFSQDYTRGLERLCRMFSEVNCLEHEGRIVCYEAAQPFPNTISAWRQCVAARRIDPVLFHFAYGKPASQASPPDERARIFRYVPEAAVRGGREEAADVSMPPYFRFLLSPQSRFLSAPGIACPHWSLEQLEADAWFQAFSRRVKEAYVFIMPDQTLPYAVEQIEWNMR